MKTSEFKKLIKESVREAFKEELKEILLEAIKSSKETKVIKESMSHGDILSSRSTEILKNPIEVKKSYIDVMKNMMEGRDELNYNTNDLIQPQQIDPIEGNLSNVNEVGMDTIMKLINPK